MMKDFRLLIGLALFLQSTGLFVLIAINPKLADNQGFMVLATAVIVTGWVGGAIAFAFTSGLDAARNSTSLGKALDLAQSKIPPVENENGQSVEGTGQDGQVAPGSGDQRGDGDRTAG